MTSRDRPGVARPASCPTTSYPTTSYPDPRVTRPRVTRPRVTRPRVTRPRVTRPRVTRPRVTRPRVARPRVARPGRSDALGVAPAVATPRHAHPLAAVPSIMLGAGDCPRLSGPRVLEDVELTCQLHAVMGDVLGAASKFELSRSPCDCGNVWVALGVGHRLRRCHIQFAGAAAGGVGEGQRRRRRLRRALTWSGLRSGRCLQQLRHSARHERSRLRRAASLEQALADTCTWERGIEQTSLDHAEMRSTYREPPGRRDAGPYHGWKTPSRCRRVGRRYR